MPPEMAVSMRHTKLKAEEAALIAGELNKPSWESKNEGIHERVSFEDTIWGFDLAGGLYYRTPLRVTFVKTDSRAEKAGIKPGDRLLRINDIDTATLTIQQAHDLILESGLHIRLAVTAPEDLTDAYYCYEDPLMDEYDAEQARLREEERARKRQVHARVSSYWSLQWPWVSKRRVIYRESNCFMVPSKYEEKHSGRFSPLPMQKLQDDVVLTSVINSSKNKNKGSNLQDVKSENLSNGTAKIDDKETVSSEEMPNTAPNTENEKIDENDKDNIDENSADLDNVDDNINTKEIESAEAEEENQIQDKFESLVTEVEEEKPEKLSTSEVDEAFEGIVEDSQEEIEPEADEISNKIDDTNEILKDNDSQSRSDEENIIDSILSDNGQNTDNSDSMNER